MTGNELINFHYDYEAKDKKSAIDAVKEEAFTIIHSLHGWCTQEKAGILIDLIYMLQPELIVEIGVFGGKSLIPMALALKRLNKGIIVGIDPWDKKQSIHGLDRSNKEWWYQVDHEFIYQEFIRNIAELKLSDYVKIVRESSNNARCIRNIDILHLDGNHSTHSTLSDVQKWVPSVKKNGLIIFEDSNWSSSSKAVEWLNTNCINLIEFNGDNVWGIWVKIG